MPYVITITTPRTATERYRAQRLPPRVSRRAVATLEEARQTVILYPGVTRKYDAYSVAEIVPTFGGTVGPLPDGTLVEVERVGWERLARLGEADTDDHDVIIAAYNAA